MSDVNSFTYTASPEEKKVSEIFEEAEGFRGCLVRLYELRYAGEVEPGTLLDPECFKPGVGLNGGLPFRRAHEEGPEEGERDEGGKGDGEDGHRVVEVPTEVEAESR